MKIAHSIICDRIEKILTKRLEKETGKTYMIFFPFDKQFVKKLDEGTFSAEYIEIIEIENEEEKEYSSKLNQAEFFQLIHSIEKKRTIQEIYNRMKKVILKNHPELYEEEFETIYFTFTTNTIEYIAVLVVVALITSLLFPQIREWFYQLFEQLTNCKI